jgi:hypothetical protein
MNDPPVTTSEIADLFARLAAQRADERVCEHADQARRLAHQAQILATQARDAATTQQRDTCPRQSNLADAIALASDSQGSSEQHAAHLVRLTLRNRLILAWLRQGGLCLDARWRYPASSRARMSCRWW